MGLCRKLMTSMLTIIILLIMGCGDDINTQEVSTYMVIYDDNGAQEGMVPEDNNDYAEGDAVTVAGNTGNLTMDGGVFMGWAKDSNSSETVYREGQTFQMNNDDVILYAAWSTTTTWSVDYDANGATSGELPAGTTEYEDGETITVLGNTGYLIRTGYNFSGWSLSDDGSGTVYTSGQTLTMNGENLTLYALWSEQVEPSGLYVADYTIAKESILRRIPDSAFTAARNNLHILYCGTSHSQQVMEGMTGLVQYKEGDDTRFAFTYNGVPQAGSLDIHYRGNPTWNDLSNDGVDAQGNTLYFRETVSYLDDASHADVNVVMWSWCSISGHNVQIYLNNFDELTAMYKAGGTKGRTADNAVTFVWMTGYALGSAGDDPDANNSPYNNHKAIVDHCRANGYFCLDYWSQDVYNYGDDSYKPTESGNANVQHYNYVQTHTDWFPCRHWTDGVIDYPAHTDDNPTYAQHLTGNRRAYAAWWIWARIAGWDGTLDAE